MQLDSILINDLQLGDKLNRSINEHRSSEFALLLSMLSHDALDFSEFQLPKSPPLQELFSYEQESSLPLSSSRPMCYKDSESYKADHLSRVFAEQGIKQLRLVDYLNPEPLSFADDPSKIADEVIENCAPSVQRKLKQLASLTEHPAIDPTGFYNTLADPATHGELKLNNVTA